MDFGKPWVFQWYSLDICFGDIIQMYSNGIPVVFRKTSGIPVQSLKSMVFHWYSTPGKM